MLRASIELLLAVFLAPLSLLYSAITTLRNIFYDYGFLQSYKSETASNQYRQYKRRWER
jgi:tetraacyldisaccharide-1-P 4'-kinase